jgi:hypothetical protein
MNQLTEAGVTILMGIIGVAILAVIVSRNSNTAGVLTSFGTAFSGMLGTAVSPITGTGAATLGGFGGLPPWPQPTGLSGGFPY